MRVNVHKVRSVPRRIGHCSPFFSIKEKQVRFSATYNEIQ